MDTSISDPIPAPLPVPKRCPPPNRKKFDVELNRVQELIRGKEAEIQELQPFCNPGCQLQDIRQEKDVLITKRREADDEIAQLNTVINHKRDQMARIQVNLQYKQEAKITEAIKRLEFQLQSNNFKLREEKKIVAEIDQLNRSRRVLKDYNALKTELDGLRKRQKSLREERDRFQRCFTELKAKEEDVKAKSQQSKDAIDALRLECSALYAEKKALVGEFRNATSLFQQQRDETRSMLRRKKEEEKLAQQEAKRREMEEIAALMEPYEEERQLCATLLVYLTRLDGSQSAQQSDKCLKLTILDAPDKGNDAVRGRSPPTDSGMLLVRPKDEEMVLFVGCAKQKKNGKKDKKNRLLNHTPDLLEQFARLNIQPPISTACVPGTIEKIRDLLAFYDEQASLEKDEFGIKEEPELKPNETVAVEPEASCKNTPKDENGEKQSSWEWVDKDGSGAVTFDDA